MAEGGSGALRYLQDLFRAGAGAGLADVELLGRFLRRDGASAESAFAALVERHGPMVLGACRALLGDAHEAEDAFQATFLVLARRAGSIRDPGLLANWLYGVAQRTAKKARGRALRRRSREVQEVEMSAREVVDRGDHNDLTLIRREQARLIHEELGRLPEKERAAVVHCCLEELTVEEAARRIRCTAGAVRGRLAQARSRLRDRLARRGVAVPPAVVAAALTARAASAAVTPGLRDSTTRAALGFIGGAAGPGAASGAVVATARSVSRLMALSELRRPAALLALAAAGAGLGAWTFGLPHRDEKAPAAARGRINPAAAPGDGPADPRQLVEGLDWILSAVDPARGTIAVQSGKGRAGGQALSIVVFRGLTMPSGLSLAGLKVDAGARVSLDGRPADLEQLRDGMRVDLELAPDRLAVAEIRARSGISDSPPFVQVVEAVDAAKGTVSFSMHDRPHRLENIRIGQGAELRRFHARPNDAIHLSNLDLQDLRPGMPASIGLRVGEDGRLCVSSLFCAAGDDGEEPSR